MIWFRALALALFLIGCGRDNLAPVPTFISIGEVQFQSASGQGTEHQLISEVWIYADSQLIGAYPVPSLVPLLGGPAVRLDIFPGIRENGQAASPTIYSMLAPWSTTVSAEPASTIALTPLFRYRGDLRFPLVEDFESSNLFREDLDGDTLTRFEVVSAPAIEGKSARAMLTSVHPLFEVASNFPLSNLPDNGSLVYLEMEYASETNLAVGLKTEDGSKTYKLLLFANDLVPQKIYVNFTAEIEAAKAKDLRITFLSTYDETAGKPEQLVILDNIKLLHFRS